MLLSHDKHLEHVSDVTYQVYQFNVGSWKCLFKRTRQKRDDAEMFLYRHSSSLHSVRFLWHEVTGEHYTCVAVIPVLAVCPEVQLIWGLLLLWKHQLPESIKYLEEWLCIPSEIYRSLRMPLYICVRTVKWIGRQERRSWAAGLQVSQERALYCSRTNLSTSEVVLESSGWTLEDVLPDTRSSVWAMDMWWCRDALRKSGHWCCACGQDAQNQCGRLSAGAVDT